MQTNDKKGIELLDENGKAKHLSSTERKAVIDVAIDECDPKLVQLLLGAKYCMLWQYWLIRAIFNFDMLFLSKMTKCELPLDIANKQLEYLSGGIQLESTARKSLVESTVAQQLAGTSLQCYRDNNGGCDVPDSIEAAVNADFSQECKSMMTESINEFKQITQSTDDVRDLQNALRDKVVKLESMEKSLSSKIDKVKEGIIKKMQDNKFLDKDFVKSEYNKLLDHYFSSSAYARNKNNLLYEYTKSNESINEAKKSLRESSLNYGFGECIDYAAQKFNNVKDKEKKEKYLDIIRVLAVNGAHSESLINIFDSKELKKIASQSIFTTARSAYQVLFDFDSSVESKFMSNIVGEDGKFADSRSQNVRILESSGSPIVKTVLGNLKKVEKELQEKRENGKANRRVGIFRDIRYYLSDFLNEKVLANKLDPQSKEQHIKTYTVLYETLEISYLAIATGDDRVIVDYGKELKSRIKKESNKDIVEVYSVLYSLFKEYRAARGREDPTSDMTRWNRIWYHFQDIFRTYNDNIREDKAIKALRIAMYATKIISEEYEEQQRQRFTREFRNIDVKFLPSNCLINWLGATYEGIQKSEQEQTAQKDKKIEHEAQAREEAEQGKLASDQRAEQESQRAEQADQRVKIISLFSRLLRKSKFDDELCDIVEGSEDAIVEAVAKHVMEHNSSPEQILNEVMREIGKNKDDILSAEDSSNAINEVIEDTIRRFIVDQVTREMVKKVDGQEMLRKKAIGLMYAGAECFKIPIEAIMENQGVRENLEQLYICLVLNIDYQEKYRNMCGEYKKLGEELKGVDSIGEKEFDKSSRLADQFGNWNKNFTECEYNAEKFADQCSDTNINELRSSVIGEIEAVRTCAEQERQILLKEKSIVEERVQERQQLNPNSSMSDEFLVPILQPGQTVILDNATFHKSKKIVEFTKSVGAEILYLPPYSPDFYDIEHHWFAIKNRARKNVPTFKSFRQAVDYAFI
ncbi:Ribonuclease H-like domain [Cinara cedri]|uniref:Ribonuclease H-like domain n=1 Tax=Cinara cedri TaxID=506608 RepID=A0A5E4NGL6_9HEMI|nr:Ribonuclease H-like domain [Cinara cedri]